MGVLTVKIDEELIELLRTKGKELYLRAYPYANPKQLSVRFLVSRSILLFCDERIK